MINRKFFFEQVRATLFAGRLLQGQVDGLKNILNIWARTHAQKDDRWLAYALATAFHETAFAVQPVHERGGNEYFRVRYDVTGRNPARARKMGNVNSGDGILFHGRGLVQLTWRMNYAKMGTAFDLDLTSSSAAADRVLEPGLAAKIMFKGMEEGLFTGRRFSDYFNATKQDWVQARRIINGLDQADVIAGYARKFHAAIRYTT